ncbi:unnamed protein product [Moneuplotes crassus]|uniref:C2H2-type domain-containing protein n=2 Tax=Euplotes crassus TaxID=5936 RepID=A0AAD1UHI7_EUPCR|nr:unnamed protein product [Moneuplotes crassus]
MFKAKYSLTRHIRAKHFKTKKHECSTCGKKFSLAHNLKEHEHIHSQALPYICGIDGCTQGFRQRGKLCLHRSKHQGYKKQKYKSNSWLNSEPLLQGETSRNQGGIGGFSNDPLNSTESNFAPLPSFGFMNSVASAKMPQSSISPQKCLNNLSQPFSSQKPHQTNQFMMFDLPQSQPSFRRERDNGFLSHENRMISDNFLFNSDNEDEEAKGMNTKVDEPLFRSSFSLMTRPQEMHHSRQSMFTFQTNSDMGGSLNRFGMGPPRNHDNIMDSQYRKFDFSHKNKY